MDRLTEKDISAYALVLLIRTGVISTGDKATTGARNLGLNRTHLANAVERYTQLDGSPPTDRPVPVARDPDIAKDVRVQR